MNNSELIGINAQLIDENIALKSKLEIVEGRYHALEERMTKISNPSTMNNLSDLLDYVNRSGLKGCYVKSIDTFFDTGMSYSAFGKNNCYDSGRQEITVTLVGYK